MPRIARAHHFIPQFMLANFTSVGTREDLLWVSDLKSNKKWKSSPANTGHRRDFYRVEGDIAPADTVESMLGSVEYKVAPVVQRVIESRATPEDKDDFQTLLYFVALLTTRIPAVREGIDDFFDRIGQRILELSVTTAERWDSLQRQMREQGVKGEDLAYDDAKQIMEDRSVRFSVNRNWQLGMMFKGAQVVFPTLLKRTWCVLVSPSGNLICSDHPVTIVFTRRTPPFFSPGFGLPDTEVSVPLSRHIMLRGIWEKQPEHAVSMNRTFVGHYNTLRMIQADRFIFSTVADFPWNDDEGRTHDGMNGLQDFIRSQTHPSDTAL